MIAKKEKKKMVPREREREKERELYETTKSAMQKDRQVDDMIMMTIDAGQWQ